MTQTSPEKGLVVGGRYRLETILGEGGMAVVWRAIHTETDRPVALKLVRRELALDTQAREMFVREARIAARIGKNDHIIDVLDAGIDDALGVPFLAMELLDGEPLDERIRREGPIPPELCRSILEQLGEALDQAHAASVVHRDLKPQNLFLTRTKKGATWVKVLDFGIAKIAESAQQATTQVGTPAYAAPEQLGPTWRMVAEKNGKTIAAQVSPATDVWALGLVAFEIFTGSRSGDLWGATTLAELPLKMVIEPLPSATTRAGERAVLLPMGFDAWLARCLHIDATQRWPTAGEAVRALLEGQGHAAAAGPAAPVKPGPTQLIATTPPHSADPSARVPSSPHGWHWTGQPMSAPMHSGTAPPAQHPQYPSAPPSPMAQTPFPRVPSFAPPAPTGAPIDPVLAQWAHQRRIEVRVGGDARAYHSWQPFQFVPPIGVVAREARATIQSAQVLIAEIVTTDDIKRALGEAQFVIALVTARAFRYRAALRPRQATGLGQSLSRGFKALDDLVSAEPKMGAPSLGDPWFEARYEVRAPTPHEGNAALPFPLRQLLVHLQFRGVIETRPGGMVVLFEGARMDPATLDRLMDLVARTLAIVV